MTLNRNQCFYCRTSERTAFKHRYFIIGLSVFLTFALSICQLLLTPPGHAKEHTIGDGLTGQIPDSVTEKVSIDCGLESIPDYHSDYYYIDASAHAYFSHSPTAHAKDLKGKQLYSLQSYFKGDAPYVSVAVDPRVYVYGTKLRIPELEAEFCKYIEFRAVDANAAVTDRGPGFIGIWVDTAEIARQSIFNGSVHIVVTD